MSRSGVVRARVGKVRSGRTETEVVWDQLAVEDPLEIRLAFGPSDDRTVVPIAVTMRTPGHDEELAVGFLLGERLIPYAGAVERVSPVGAEMSGKRVGDAILVDLRPDVAFDPRRLDRRFVTGSSCGVCGKMSLKALGLDGHSPLTHRGPILDASFLRRLPGELRRTQEVFEATGGLHAAALFDASGNLLAAREDIGRHNAVDKLVGALALGRLGAQERRPQNLGLVVSGRIGFEIVQKALAAGIALIAAVGPPSSLAVEIGEAFGMTLLGFLDASRFNIYCGPERVRLTDAASPAREALVEA